MWTILYTYPGYDGEIDRLECRYNREKKEDEYIIFESKKLAEEYCKAKKYNKKDYRIVFVRVITKETISSIL